MKITHVSASARKKEFAIVAGGRSYVFPYAKLPLMPTADDPVVEVLPDDELGGEAFTYRLDSGKENTVHLDAVREVNLDPDYLQGILMHRLTVEAKKGLEKSRLGVRQVARQLGTSPAQVYRLLDPANGSKSLGQLLMLLNLLDLRVDVRVAPKETGA